MTRWFNEWARRNLPYSRYGDHDLALTWQWAHVAHGHLDLSPVWRGKHPTTKDRARYRRFADSLGRTPTVRARLRPPQARLIRS